MIHREGLRRKIKYTAWKWAFCLGVLVATGCVFSIALASTMPEKILGAIPLNPATPVFDDPRAMELTPIYQSLAETDLAQVLQSMAQTKTAYRMDPEKARAEDPFQQFPEDTEAEVVDLYFAATDLASPQAFATEVGLVLDKDGWGIELFAIQRRVEFFTGLTEVGTPYNKLWAQKLSNARLLETSGGHMGHTSPTTRGLLMACVVKLTQGEVCNS